VLKAGLGEEVPQTNAKNNLNLRLALKVIFFAPYQSLTNAGFVW